MIQDLTDLGREEAVALLEKSDRRVKLALLMHWTGLDAAAGEQRLANCQAICVRRFRPVCRVKIGLRTI
jgi:N-acetylmuramic acid 6-phosphate etherase